MYAGFDIEVFRPKLLRCQVLAKRFMDMQHWRILTRACLIFHNDSILNRREKAVTQL